jgi:hypothetical protein
MYTSNSEKQIKPKISKWKEIIKNLVEINEVESKRTRQKSMKQRLGSSKR